MALRARVFAAQRKVDAAGLAGGTGDRLRAAFGRGLFGTVHPVEDRTDLGEQLCQVDHADPGQIFEQVAPRMGDNSDGDQPLNIADDRLQRLQHCAVTIAASVAGGKPTGATGAARSRLSNSAGLFPPR